MADCMDGKWVCWTCYAKFTFGEIIMDKDQQLKCPKCGDIGYMHPIGEADVVLTEYHGEIGTKQ